MQEPSAAAGHRPTGHAHDLGPRFAPDTTHRIEPHSCHDTTRPSTKPQAIRQAIPQAILQAIERGSIDG